MPATKTQVERVDLAERKEEHEEYQPRQKGLERHQPLIAQSADDHREPEGVAVKQAFDI